MASPSPVGAELRALWRLAAPLAAVQAGGQLMSLVDTAVVGRLSPAAQSGAGLGHAAFFLVSIVGMGIMMGLDPLVSQALGAGDPIRARRLWWQAQWLALLLSAALCLPIALAAPLLPWLGVRPEIAEQAHPFLQVRVAGLLPLLLFTGSRSYLMATGHTRPMVVAMVLGNAFNAAAAVLLVFGGAALPGWTGPLARLPGLGVVGAALSTSLCMLFQLALVALAVRALPVAGFSPADRRPSLADLGLALRVGLPIGLQMGAEVGIFALVALLAGRIGAQALAAHQVALNLAGLSFTVALGIGEAGAVRVGRAIGAGDAAATRRAGMVALASGAGFMSLSALAFVLAPSPLARLLSPEPSVVAAAAPLIGVAAVFQLSDGLQSVGAGVLRGAGDSRFAFLANLAGHYLVGVPVAVGLGLWAGRGVVGLWWGLCAGLTAVAASLVARFLRLSSRPIAPLARRGAATRRG